MTESQWNIVVAAAAALKEIESYIKKSESRRERISQQTTERPYGPTAMRLIDDAEDAYCELFEVSKELGLDGDVIRIGSNSITACTPIEAARRFVAYHSGGESKC
tara:strand:- start:16 stop:330 length:315 start_codon:yes stop_codon:yes gene_type:complete